MRVFFIGSGCPGCVSDDWEILRVSIKKFLFRLPFISQFVRIDFYSKGLKITFALAGYAYEREVFSFLKSLKLGCFRISG